MNQLKNSKKEGIGKRKETTWKARHCVGTGWEKLTRHRNAGGKKKTGGKKLKNNEYIGTM